MLGNAKSINGICDLRETKSGRRHDWINHRDQALQNLYPMGPQSARAGKCASAVLCGTHMASPVIRGSIRGAEASCDGGLVG